MNISFAVSTSISLTSWSIFKLVGPETDNVENNAEKKLNNKNCDWIVANDVSNKKIGFSSDFNEVTIYYRDKDKEKLSYKKKSEISDEIVDRIINQLN